jgi:hypothetical protein
MGLIDQNFTKINELIYGLNEMDRLLLYDENDKFVNVEKDLALETKRMNFCLRSYLILILKSLVLSLQMMN